MSEIHKIRRTYTLESAEAFFLVQKTLNLSNKLFAEALGIAPSTISGYAKEGFVPKSLHLAAQYLLPKTGQHFFLTICKTQEEKNAFLTITAALNLQVTLLLSEESQ